MKSSERERKEYELLEIITTEKEKTIHSFGEQAESEREVVIKMIACLSVVVAYLQEDRKKGKTQRSGSDHARSR
jgi:hypothetical protein